MSTEEHCCICLDPDNPDNLSKLPCDVCKGTSVWVHKECINEWLSVPTETPRCPTCNLPAKISTKTKNMKTFVTFASHVRSKVSSNRKSSLAIYTFVVFALLFVQYFPYQNNAIVVKDTTVSDVLLRTTLTLVGAFAWLVLLLALTKNLSELYVKHYSTFAERTYIWE